MLFVLAAGLGLGTVLLPAQPPGDPRTAVPRPSPSNPSPRTPTPPLIGTLSTEAARGLGAPSTRGTALPPSRGALRGTGRPLGIGGYIPLTVIDAPVYQRGGSTLGLALVSPEVVTSPAFYPTMQPPSWRVVSEERPVQGWRVVDVTDVVCTPNGACSAVTTRLLARWAPSLRAYAFRDRVGRVWRVE